LAALDPVSVSFALPPVTFSTSEASVCVSPVVLAVPVARFAASGVVTSL
jgi:hypothetical protein